MLGFVLALCWACSSAAWPLGPTGGSASQPVSCEDLSAEPITYGMIYDVPGATGLPDDTIDIFDVWLQNGCTGCHNASAAGGLRLNQPQFVGSTLVGVPSTRYPDLPRVSPTFPDGSLLYAMLNCTPRPPYPTMPNGASRIPRRQRALVHDWIEQGARAVGTDGNPVGPVIFRDAFESQRFQLNLQGP
jgi:hypothetical protein